MKFVFGVFSLVNHAMCMQMSVNPGGELELVENVVGDVLQEFCDEKECGTEFNLNGHDPVNNNLGGKGPAQGPEEIRFRNAATIKCQSVDLVLKTTSEYTPGMTPNTGNGAKNGFAGVTMAAGTGVDVELTLVDSSSGAPVNVDDFTIWIYDIDMGKRERGRESVKACGAASVTALVPDPSFMKGSTDGDCTTFTAQKKGTKKDNPSDRNNLDEAQKKRVVKATWTNANKASLRLALGAGGDGRGFQFTATAKTICPTTTTTTTPAYSTPKPQPPDPTTKCEDPNGGHNCSLKEVCEKGVEMQFFKYNIVHNNLGGLGPQFDHPPVLQYTKVAQHEGRDLDLIVTASSQYKDLNWNYRRRTGRDTARAYNGVAGGGAGGIFSMAPVNFEVTFKLVWTDTQQPAVIPYWMMTYYDLDGNYESVGTCDAESIALFEHTTMQGPGCSNGCCMEKGARAEYQSPSSWDHLSNYYKEDAVTFIFHDKSEGKFNYISTYYHRMWYFKGSKALACSSR